MEQPARCLVLSQTKHVQAIQSYLFEVYFNIILTPTTRSSWSLSFRFPTNILHAFLFSTRRENLSFVHMGNDHLIMQNADATHFLILSCCHCIPLNTKK
jgi:hypothetical protein